MDFVATASVNDSVGSSMIYTKQGEETVPFFSEPSAAQKPELAELAVWPFSSGCCQNNRLGVIPLGPVDPNKCISVPVQSTAVLFS